MSEGETLSSPDWLSEIEKWQARGLKEVNFIIGGPDGISEDVRKMQILCYPYRF